MRIGIVWVTATAAALWGIWDWFCRPSAKKQQHKQQVPRINNRLHAWSDPLYKLGTQNEASSADVEEQDIQKPLLVEPESLESIMNPTGRPEQINLAHGRPLLPKRDPVDQEYLQVLIDSEFGPPKFSVSGMHACVNFILL